MSRTLSTPLFDAASISIDVDARPSAISTQGVQTPQGSAVGAPFSQFSAFATSRAVVVFPTPRGPVNRNAWASWPVSSAFESVRTTCACPDISPNVLGPVLAGEDQVGHGLVEVLSVGAGAPGRVGPT